MHIHCESIIWCYIGRVGSAFAAELGTMAVSEQTDSLRVLGSDPVNYLISPRILACMVATPILNLLCFCMGTLSCSFIPESHMRSEANQNFCLSCCCCTIFVNFVHFSMLVRSIHWLASSLSLDLSHHLGSRNPLLRHGAILGCGLTVCR